MTPDTFLINRLAWPDPVCCVALVVDTGLLPGSSAEQLQALGIRLGALSRRLWELVDVDTDPQVERLMQKLQTEAPVRELRADIRGWRLKIQETLRKLARSESHPQGFPKADRLAKGQAQILRQLEARLRETLNNDLRAKLTDRDGESFYRLLGAYRGVSEALVDYAASAERIDWARWRENRF